MPGLVGQAGIDKTYKFLFKLEFLNRKKYSDTRIEIKKSSNVVIV